MRKVADRWIAANPVPGNANWDEGVLYGGISALFRETSDNSYFQDVHAWGVQNGWAPFPDGGVTTIADYTLCGMAYWDQEEAGDSAATLANVEPSLAAQRSADYPWIDLFFMGFPLSARYGQSIGDPSYFDGIHRIFTTNRDVGVAYLGQPARPLYSPDNALWWRDTRFSGSDVFWSRGNGWVLAGLAETIENLSPGSPDRQDYISMAQSMAAQLKALQQPSGFWPSSLLPSAGLDSADPETSGTALFTFGMTKLVRLGDLAPDLYLPVVSKSWNAMVEQAVEPDGTLGFCQPGGDRPTDGGVLATQTNDFCVGAFLLAGSELALGHVSLP